jgi:prepilin peptidase CpaA
MGWGSISIGMLAAFALLLVAAGVEDARTREIANWKSGAIALLAPFWWWLQRDSLWPDVAVQIAIALFVFLLFAAAFRFGWMGGGDVKLIGALALWFPPLPLVNVLMVMSMLGGAITLILVIERALRRKTAQIEVPYGIAIAIAALLSLREPILNGFTR